MVSRAQRDLRDFGRLAYTFAMKFCERIALILSVTIGLVH